MMTNNLESLEIRLFQTLYTDERFASIFRAMDRLHDVASEGKLEQVTNLPKEEVIGWLKDIAYTITETIHELEEGDHEQTQNPCIGSDSNYQW